MSTTLSNEILVEFGSISVGDRAASGTVKFPIDDTNDRQHVGDCWAEYTRRRLTGKILLGEEMPTQKRIKGHPRLVIKGSFDTHKPSFSDDAVSLKISFDKNEIEADQLIRFSYKKAWLVISEIGDIPKDVKEKGGRSVWENQPITEIGITDATAKKLIIGEVTTVGDIIALALGNHDGHTFDSLKITKPQQDKIQKKLELFFEESGLDNPFAE